MIPSISAGAHGRQHGIHHEDDLTSVDPQQQKIMMFMNIAFIFLFAWLPAGLLLYITLSNVLSSCSSSMSGRSSPRESDRTDSKTVRTRKAGIKSRPFLLDYSSLSRTPKFFIKREQFSQCRGVRREKPDNSF